MIAQIIDAATVGLWAFGTGYILFALLKHTIGLRVSKEEELIGLDIGEHGCSAYPEFVTQETGEGMPVDSSEGVRT